MPQQHDERQVLTIREAAKALGLSTGATYELARNGDLPAIRLGSRRILIARDRFERLIAGETPTPIAS